MTSKPLHCLVIELPGTPPRHFLLDAATIRLGRIAGNAIVVEEDAVSARHCELRRTASGYQVVDLGSTNGTRLNGEALGADPRDLHDGDILLLGIAAKARFVRVHEIRDKAGATTAVGSTTRRLEPPELPPRPAINPVAAAVAKASRAIPRP
jgi:pSer/pThr/pTyr-binding forkhead associated (FHA) protein